MIRTFIAIDLSPHNQANLAALIKELMQAGSLPVRWTVVPNIHITIKFLGDVAEQSLPLLQQKLALLASEWPSFTIQIGTLGAFPSPKKPRIIWVGCQFEKSGLLFQQALEGVMNEIGFPREKRAFSPHLTIGRVTNSAVPLNFSQLEKLITRTNASDLGTLRVNSFRMYRSDLHPSGSQYRVLYTFELGSHGPGAGGEV